MVALEFFRLCLPDIKAKYFDNGLKDHLANDYSTIGLIMALSTLQNGSIPRFLREDHLQALFSSKEPSSPCISKLQIGFKNQAPVVRKSISANPRLNRPNPQNKFVLRLNSVPRSSISTIQRLN